MTSALASLISAGRTLDDELSALVVRYGADSVREAARRATRKKRGRRPEMDWPLLKPWLERDVEDWFSGSDPFAARTNYLIAKEFAEQFPGHSIFATKDRIERKLRKLRRWSMFARAQMIAEDQHPFSVYLRALRGLVGADGHPVWEKSLERALGRLARYRERFGEPDETATFASLEAQLNVEPYNALLEPLQQRGIFGALRAYGRDAVL